MKLPRTVKRYCAHCKKHTDQDVERGKKRRASELSWGQRRFRRATAGYTGFPRPKPEGREKPTKRIWLKYICKTCKKAQQPAAIRAKKFELVEVKA
jgi:large subunit ribosomal protein L44e